MGAHLMPDVHLGRAALLFPPIRVLFWLYLVTEVLNLDISFRPFAPVITF
jgi:hypothetical protein